MIRLDSGWLRQAALVLSMCVGAAAGESGQAPGRVAIRIDVAAEPPEWPTPCTVGVPFPRGVLGVGDAVALLNADGQAVPLQTRAHATWNPDGTQGVRWLLLDFQPRDRRPHTLVFGGDRAEPPSHSPADIAFVEGGRITIDTGVLRTNCPVNRFDPWSDLTIGGRKQIDTSSPYGLMVTHERRGDFLAVNDENATVEVEENGPWRATLKARGWYVNADGERFGRYQVRLHFFRNQPDVRMEHTFIFTGETLHDRITGLTVSMPLVMQGQFIRGAVPLEQYSRTSGLNDFKRPPHWSVISDLADGRTLAWEFKELPSGRTIYTGQKNAGFVGMRTDAASLVMVLKDAWEQSPFEVEVENATLRFHLWPAHGRTMDLSFDGMWHHLTEAQKLQKAAAKTDVGTTPEEKLAWCRSINGSGIAKTHELWLLFRPDDVRMYPSRAALVDEPVLAVVDPVWACRTEALMQPAHPYDPVSFRDEEAFLSSVLDLRLAERDAGRIYGFFDFGGYHQLPFVQGPNLDAGIWHRARPKAHYGWSTFGPVQYFRTGDRRYLRYAKEYTRYAADRTFCYHDHFETRDFEGAEYHYNHSEIGWLGRSQWASVLQGKEDAVFLYWMTGERRMLDAALMWAQGSERYESGGIPWESSGRWFRNMEDAGPYKAMRRQLGAMLQRWTVLYAATWDPRWKVRADRIAAGFRALDLSRDDPKDYPGYLQYHAGWVYEGLDFYHRVTGDPEIASALQAFCRQAMERSPGFVTGGSQSGSLNPYSFGFLLTGDTDYLRLGRHALLQRLDDWASPEALGPRAKWAVQTLPRFMGAFMKAPPEFLADNLPTHERGLLAAWPQAHRAFILQETDGPIDIMLASHWGGRYVLSDPDGLPCATVTLSYETTLTGGLSAGPDGKTGTYTLSCVEPGQPPYHRRPWEYLAMHCVLRSSPGRVVYELPPANPHPRPVARHLVLRQLPGEAGEVRVVMPWGDVVSNRRDMFVPLDGKGPRFDLGTMGPVGDAFRIVMPQTDVPRLWQYSRGMVEGNFSTAYEARTGGRIEARGFAPWFATTPEAFFVPAGDKTPEAGHR